MPPAVWTRARKCVCAWTSCNDYISTVAFVQSVAHPTDATATFVTNLNALIDEMNALYNQRIAQAKRGKEDPEA